MLKQKNIHLLKCGKINQGQVLNLRKEALVFVRTCSEKVAERTPLMSIVVRNSEAICTKVMAASQDFLKKKVKNVIQ